MSMSLDVHKGIYSSAFQLTLPVILTEANIINRILFSGIICYSTWILIWILLAAFTYRDAVRRGRNGTFWFVVVFALQLVGLIIWFVARPPKQVVMQQKAETSIRNDMN